MPSEEFEQLKEALREAPTEAARKRAAEAMRRYLATQPTKKSRPILVSLGYRKTYPHAIPLEKIPEEIEKNPEFYDLMKRVVREK